MISCATKKDNSFTEQQPVIAFYAPLKSPLHATPSGDRKIAQLFVAALQTAGFNVELASQLRSFDKLGNSSRQQRILSLAQREAKRIIKRWRRLQIRPCAWFSYHLYYKAPDLIGPIVCRELQIPYLVAEASWAAKRASGPWSLYHAQVDKALQQANHIICINPVDKIALEHYFATASQSATPITTLKPYLADTRKHSNTEVTASQIAERFGLNSNLPWLICIAMMRSGDKQQSYDILQQVTHKLTQPYQLLIIGDGENSAKVTKQFASNDKVRFAGTLDNETVISLLAHFQLLVWPAINEALGMIFLEAQQAGVAVVAGDQGGVSSVVKHNHSGLLLPVVSHQDLAIAMALSIDQLLIDNRQLLRLQTNAKDYVAQNHSLSAAAAQLKQIVNRCLQEFKESQC